MNFMGMCNSSTWGGGLKLHHGRPVCQPRDQPLLVRQGGLSVCTFLQGSEDVGTAIAASDADMDTLNSRNAQDNHIIWATYVVLLDIFRSLTMQRLVGTCCYLLHRLLRPQ